MPKDQKERPRVVVEEVPKVAEEAPKVIEETPVSTEENAKVSSTDLIESKDIPENVEMEVKSKAADYSKSVIPEPKQPSIVLWILIPGIFLLGALLGGVFFYQKGVNKSEGSNPTPTATSSAIPSPSPTSNIDLTKYSVSILNGSGISGEAGRAKTLVTAADFEVSSTGNAATYDFTKTLIKAKATVEAAFTTKLSETLAKTYVVDTLQTLPATSTIEVQVIVGSSKAQ